MTKIEEIRRKIDRREIKIEYAKSSRETMLRSWISRVLDAVGHPGAFITSESLLCDFVGRDVEEGIRSVEQKLGVRIGIKDKVMDVANRLRLQS